MIQKFSLLVLLAIFGSTSAASALDLAELRLTCQEESRRRFKGPRRMKPDMYRLVVERRKAYVRTCMSEGMDPAERTASLGGAADKFAATED